MISYGQHLLGEYLAAITGKRPELDARPAWLDGLELDVWYPDFDLALEFQGHHHFAPLKGQVEDFQHQLRRDRRKVEACERQGIVLVRVRISDLRHPTISEHLCRRMVQSYGESAGRRRHAEVCLNQHLDVLHQFNRRFHTYRHNQQLKAISSTANPKQRRALRRALA